MIRNLLLTMLLAGVSGAAFANSCPLLMKDIDAALQDPAVAQQLNEEQLMEARQLREQGEEAHRAGDHAKSMESLQRAKDILGIS